ncbi:hypothetical protein M758_11G051400 [Ceratodon purpureus]|uniref:VPS9 domain-containing protein n=1 Tax=Ceratodon purpureus TaxID=3225 RepID=A0A8T0GBK6_CERPU|nr:hypothetical protein KC19_11G053200 [Ceratodon purpureus]KAG0600659.1 hypothetical protein M758_11G051400 [Ceratodon purpureus]
MKFPFRRRKSLPRGKSEEGSGGVSGVKARIQLRLLSQLKWEANAPKKVKGEKAEKVRQVQPAVVKALWPDLDTLEGCTEFLKSSGLNTRALAHAARMVDHFKSSYQMGDSSLPDEFRIEAWKGTLRRIVKTLVDQLLASNPRLESACVGNEESMGQLWSACETWVLGSVYDKIMGACKQMFGQSDKILDDNLARLDKVDPIVLGVRSEFKEFVLGEALLQFRMINRGRTPLEKAICLRKTINCIIEGIQTVISSCSGTSAEKDGLLPCTDDLLSFMLLLMARSRVKNLQANACYMHNFLSLQMEDEQSGELAYHVTNFVAACNYLNTGEVEKLLATVPVPSNTETTPTSVKSPGSVASSPPIVTPVYNRSYSFEPDVHTMSGGEIFTVNMFDGQSSGRRRSQGEIELRSFSEKNLGESGFRGSSMSKGGDLNLAFARDSPEFILAPTYQ